MKTKLKYQINLSETQMQILWDSLELYCRINMGQWGECVRNSKVPNALMYECERQLEKVAEDFNATPTIGSFYGVLSKELPKEVSISFDMEQVIRYHLSWDRKPNGGIGVHFDEPGHWNKDVPLLEVETIR